MIAVPVHRRPGDQLLIVAFASDAGVTFAAIPAPPAPSRPQLEAWGRSLALDLAAKLEEKGDPP